MSLPASKPASVIRIDGKPRFAGGASRSLTIFFYIPLDPAYKAGLARHVTGQLFFQPFLDGFCMGIKRLGIGKPDYVGTY